MKTSTKQTIEIIGIFGVIASLIFVGMQLLLDRRVAMGAQFHARTALYHQAQQSIFENDSYVQEQAAIWENGLTPPWWNSEIEKFQQDRGMSMEGMYQRYTLLRMRMLRFNDNYFQYERGLISEETWQTNRNALKNNMRQFYTRTVALNFNVFEAAFDELIQEIIHEIELEN